MGIIYCNRIEEPVTMGSPHSHNVWEIILCTSGESQYHIGDKVYHIVPGDIFVIPPNTTHYFNAFIPYTDIYAMVDCVDFEESFRTKDYDNNILALMEILRKTFLIKDGNYWKIADSLWQTINLYLQNNRTIHYKHAFIGELKNTIDNNVSNSEFSITSVICDMGYQQDYVRKCFSAEFGTTPSKYLTTLRINQAKELFENHSEILVEEVAFRCGFRDTFYFSRVFKKLTGVSPLQYKLTNAEFKLERVTTD